MKRLWICLSFITFVQAEEVNFSFAPVYSLPSLQKSFGAQDTRFWKGEKSALSKSLARRGRNAVLHGHVQDPSLQWDWGFRSGLKYDDPYSEWHITGTYTHFHSKPYASLQSEGELFPLWNELESPEGQELEKSSHSRWRLDVDIADMEVGKIFAVKRFINIRPHVGVRSTWMYQKFTIDYERYSKGFLKEPALWNNCLGLGTRGGVDTFWFLGKRFSFFSDGAISWLYGYHNIHERQSLVSLGTSEPTRPSIDIAMLEASLGLQYERIFPRLKRSLTIKMGYEINYFVNRNHWVDWFSPMANNLSQERIALQGFSLGLHFGF